MSEQTIAILIRAAVEFGASAIVAISSAIHAGDVDTTKQLAAILPDAEAQLLADEALIQQQRKLAGLAS